jgi:hypothetical protein
MTSIISAQADERSADQADEACAIRVIEKRVRIERPQRSPVGRKAHSRLPRENVFKSGKTLSATPVTRRAAICRNAFAIKGWRRCNQIGISVAPFYWQA